MFFRSPRAAAATIAAEALSALSFVRGDTDEGFRAARLTEASQRREFGDFKVRIF